MKNFLISALFGVTALLLLHLFSAFTGIEVVISKLSLLVGTCLGIPGVVLILLLNAVFKI